MLLILLCCYALNSVGLDNTAERVTRSQSKHGMLQFRETLLTLGLFVTEMHVQVQVTNHSELCIQTLIENTHHKRVITTSQQVVALKLEHQMIKSAYPAALMWKSASLNNGHLRNSMRSLLIEEFNILLKSSSRGIQGKRYSSCFNLIHQKTYTSLSWQRCQ